MTLSIDVENANETEIETLKNVDFGEMESDSELQEFPRKRDSGYNYEKPIRYNRLNFRSRNRGRLNKHRNQLNRPFNLYGPPKIHEPNQNQQRPNNQHREPNQPSENLHQGISQSIKNHEFSEPDPIPEQNDYPFLTGTANYLPPKNQKLPSHSAMSAFSEQQNFNENMQDNRISDAALFLQQNAQSLSQLYGAPALNQDYAPNNEYLNQLSNQQQNNLHSQNVVENPKFPGPLPSYASGILNPQETLANIQSLEKDRLIAQLRLALENQAQIQNSLPLGRHSPAVENVHHQTGNGDANLEDQQLVSPSVFGGERTPFGHSSFLSGSAISSPGLRITYGLPSSSQVPISSVATPIRPQVPLSGASSPSESVGSGAVTPTLAPGSLKPGSAFIPNFPHYGTYIPSLIPGTNFIANIPSGLLGSNFIPVSNNPNSSSPTHFGIPIPTIPDQKPVSGTPTLSIPSNKPGVQFSSPSHSVYPISTVAIPAQPIYPISNPVHSVVNPIQPAAKPIQTIRPVTAYPEVTPAVPPTYGVQSSILNSLLIKPVKPVIPLYYYPNVNLQIPKPSLTTNPWNYATTLQQAKPNWKR